MADKIETTDLILKTRAFMKNGQWRLSVELPRWLLNELTREMPIFIVSSYGVCSDEPLGDLLLSADPEAYKILCSAWKSKKKGEAGGESAVSGEQGNHKG